ncbi:beta-N-acetylhexosaminidase [Qingshengfaniella alkalisoli]|uniref:beta-N-acetylhexosaminidase n=1 Tax=Qingshengfaniella alkalisoli TaxID=2599296 RepID=A0A5B8IA35_9RHOB|nr:family 20 glycosylhydrolase [Qingshengfaniella alkalisoli]QDY70909.1 beta-N-acetylhexosaminidase [Qingshengfaniella alkalisoli]
MTDLRLDTRFIASDTPEKARFEFKLYNLGSETLTGFKFAYAALTRIRDGAKIENATFLRRFANFHEYAAPEALTLAPGEAWSFAIEGLTHLPKHRLDGPKSAYLTNTEGAVIPCEVGDLALVGGADTGELRHVPEGKALLPLAIQPWPNMVSVSKFQTARPYVPASDATDAQRQAMAATSALAKRLFPIAQTPFRLDGENGIEVIFKSGNFPKSGYSLQFDAERVTLGYGDASGLSYALTVLAQMHHAASLDPDTFELPANGQIEDAPRYGWRGSHLDVSRHFWDTDQVKRFLDILAWSRMNIFQWHLTDDEGWRIEIKALPELTQAGARRGPDCEMIGQLGHIERHYEGHYTQDQIREVVAHAQSLHIDIIPEIDIPGHCTAVLAAYPHLRDPNEPEDNYRSVQGYPNNALNPAMPETFEFLETVFAEVAELFPASHIHVGADEVDKASWQKSPLAQDMMKDRNIEAGTMGLQAYLLRRGQEILRRLGKNLAGWDEVSYGGGIDTDGALLVAWQKPEVIRELVRQGYDVIASPGQAYYMDMVQASGWNEPGAGWAGVATPEHSYTYEAIEGLTPEEAAKVKGVQSCIWGEHLISTAHFNYMVFPRIFAVAEAGWTQPDNKDWMRFCAICRQMPQL